MAANLSCEYGRTSCCIAFEIIALGYVVSDKRRTVQKEARRSAKRPSTDKLCTRLSFTGRSLQFTISGRCASQLG